jgi:hypothetical protein
MDSKKLFSILNSNICTTYRMEFCEEIKDYQSFEKLKEINLHKSKHRVNRILDIFTNFYNSSKEKLSIAIFTIQELRSYLLDDFSSYFNNIDYQLIIFPAYPDIKTEEIIIDPDDESNEMKHKKLLKRFSFIIGIAIPKNLEIINKFILYLSDTPNEFNYVSSWGQSGTRVCGGIEVKSTDGNQFKIFSTQFGMEVNERLKSSELIANQFRYEEIPTLICGDFNSFTNIENYDYKGKEQVEIMKKVFKRVPISGGTFIGIRPVEKEIYCVDLENGFMSSCLDHIFYKGEIKCLNYGMISPANKIERLFPFSDHCFIWLDLEFL